MTLQPKNAAGLALIFWIAVSSIQTVTGRWSVPQAKFSCAIGHVGLASLLPRQVTGWRAGTTASKVHGAAALLATNALLLPQGSDALLSTGTTASKVQSAVALLATNALFKFQETEASFGGTCGYGSPTGTCGANDCCQNQQSNNACTGGLQNACDNGSVNIHVGCWSCCGSYACTGINGLHVLDHACVADYSCTRVKDSTIGSGSCKGEYACHEVTSSTIGNGSCNGPDKDSNVYYFCRGMTSSIIGDGSCSGTHQTCNYCYEGNVPDNSCNNLSGGWTGDKTADNNYSGYNNYCQFCRNCMIENTKQSCYVSSLSATSSAKRLPSTRGLKVRDPSGQKKGDAECSALKDTILTFFMSVQELPSISPKLVGNQTKAQVVGNKPNKPGDYCTIKWSFVSEHLGNMQELEAMCNALEAIFSLKKNEFLTNHPSFADLVLACDPKDLNANKGDTKKKGEKTKKKKKSASKALAVSPLNV